MNLTFKVTAFDATWTGIIKIKEVSSHCIAATIAYRGNRYDIFVIRYMNNPPLCCNYGIFIPEDDFGCKFCSEIFSQYNYDQLSRHTCCPVDIYSEIAAIEQIIPLFK